MRLIFMEVGIGLVAVDELSWSGRRKILKADQKLTMDVVHHTHGEVQEVIDISRCILGMCICVFCVFLQSSFQLDAHSKLKICILLKLFTDISVMSGWIYIFKTGGLNRINCISKVANDDYSLQLWALIMRQAFGMYDLIY